VRLVLFHAKSKTEGRGTTSLTVAFRNRFAKTTKKSNVFQKPSTVYKKKKKEKRRGRKSNFLRPAAFGIQTNQQLYRFNIELLYPILEKFKYFLHKKWSYVIPCAPALLILTQPQSDHYHEPWSPLESVSSP